MTPAAAHEIMNRTLWARFAYYNRLATEAQQGAVSGDFRAVARFARLAAQAFDAQCTIIGLKGSVDVPKAK